jgi:hypothetical protein
MSELVRLRVGTDLRDAWKAKADALGLTLSAWIRMRCTVGGTTQEHFAAASLPAPTASTKRVRTGLCVHRRQPDEFCSRCDGGTNGLPEREAAIVADFQNELDAREIEP